MSDQTIELTYTCDLCGVKDREVRVPARQDEDVVQWLGQIAMAALQADHEKISPGCRPENFTDIKIPVSGADKIGGIIKQ